TAETRTTRHIFLHDLVTRTTDKIKIRAELLNILLAGRDTTASLLSNLFWSLSHHQPSLHSLYAELDAAGLLRGDTDYRDLGFQTLKSLPFLRAALSESLRLHPVVPTNGRQAIVDTVLPRGGGPDGKSPMFVPKDALVAYGTYAMQRREDLYGPDAQEWKVERWLDDEEKKGLRVGWEFLPFNGGPRICIGQQFALTEASYVVVRLLQEFKAMEARDSEPWREMLTLTCTSLGGCKVGVTPRQ
ncbi:MAG: hypothetical protein Q9214_007625, partial [Letrouitia sp. 1 TL-2023]